MKLEDQVAPLALAVRMKELGFPQDTAFSWYVRRTPDGSLHEDGLPAVRATDGAPVVGGSYEPPPGFEGRYIQRHELVAKWEIRYECAAPTVAEMLEWLPDYWNVWRGAPVLGSPRLWYVEDDDDTGDASGITAAEALARALVEGVGSERFHKSVPVPRTVPEHVKDVKSAGPSGGPPRG